jgi:pyruvate kinase
MIEAGMNVARLNFSHGTHDSHARIITAIRRLSDRVGILQDLQGPRIRTGRLAGSAPVVLNPGQRFTLTTRRIEGDARRVSVTLPSLPKNVRPGVTILIDDGLLQLRVTGVRGWEIECRVVVGGELHEHKGINVPAAHIRAPALTPKDVKDLLFGIEQDVDFVALSFVRSAGDIRRARRVMRKHGADIPIIAKIERREALENIEQIMEAADGIMVARGDLGVETSSADVPILQKRLIALSNQFSKMDITATQMLQSMTANPRPTRAEACDVANAVFDGTDALMLSAESATGKYPVEVVHTMAQIAARAEENLEAFGRRFPDPPAEKLTVSEATARAACLAARELRAAAIAVLTRSGRSALITSQRRPLVPIIAVTPSPRTVRRLSLVWGVTPVLLPEARSVDDMMANLQVRLLRSGLVQRGQTVVVTAGTTMLPGATNMMRVLKVGEPRG